MTYVKNKLNIAVARWSLDDVEEIYALDDRAVYRAKSKKYGAVILKINQCVKYSIGEYQMLNEMSGMYCCQIYGYDDENGLLLEEEILPGIVLRKEPDVDIRVKRFAELFREIHVVPSGELRYDTYLEWLERACIKMQDMDTTGILTHEIEAARDICGEMFQKYPDRVLLHGDLHHDNMLLSSDGSYVMIDPKGVIGPEIFDVPRFIMNELDPAINQTGKSHIYHVINGVSEALQYPFEDISQLFFMEVILGSAWSVEDGEEPDRDAIRIAAEICNERQGNP